MKKLIYTFLMLVTLASCTQNKTYIGDLFGLWRVMDIQIDGVSEEDYDKTLCFGFQNDVVAMQRRGDGYTITGYTYGQFFKHDKSKTIDMWFDMPDWKPLEMSHFNEGLTVCSILELNRKNFRFSATIDGKEYIYILKKWN